MQLNYEQCIVDDLLCFISSTVNTFSREQIILSCINFYSPDTIKSSKKIICQLLDIEPKWCRVNSDKKRRELEDLINLFVNAQSKKAAEKANILPKFVADSYKAFPTMNGFEVVVNDVKSLNQDISYMKDILNSFIKDNKKHQCTAASEDIGIIKEEIMEIKNQLHAKSINNRKKTVSGTSHEGYEERSASPLFDVSDEERSCFEPPAPTAPPFPPSSSQFSPISTNESFTMHTEKKNLRPHPTAPPLSPTTSLSQPAHHHTMQSKKIGPRLEPNSSLQSPSSNNIIVKENSKPVKTYAATAANAEVEPVGALILTKENTIENSQPPIRVGKYMKDADGFLTKYKKCKPVIGKRDSASCSMHAIRRMRTADIYIGRLDQWRFLHTCSASATHPLKNNASNIFYIYIHTSIQLKM